MNKFIALLFLVVAAAAVAVMPANAKPLSCDSSLQTFSTPDKLMRVTSAFAYKLPDGSTSDTMALDAGIEAYFEGSLDAILQLRSEPSSSGQIKLAVEPGSIWRVTGDPICVEEPQFNDSVTIYVPVEWHENPGLTGYLIESRNWKNIELSDLTVNAPTDTLQRLSLYFLEPQILNPNLPQNNLDLQTAFPEPACAFGGISYVRPGEAARRATRIEVGEMAPAWNFEYDYAYFFGASMPLFGEVFVEDNHDPVDLGTWYSFLYEDFKADSAYAVPPGVLSGASAIQVLDGPVCSRVYHDIVLEDTEGDTIGIYFQFAVPTWYRLRVTQNGQQYEGWFPESIQWRYLYLNTSTATINLYHDFAAYFLVPEPANNEQEFYVDNWNILGDLELGESGAMRPDTFYGLPRIDAGSETCDLALPTRLNDATRARVIVPALNLRSLPSTSGAPLIGMGQNTVVKLLGPTLCADGLRWWAATVSGGTLGNTTLTGWTAENDAAVYYLEPVAGAGDSVFVGRPTPVPPTATSTPLPVAQPTQPPAPTRVPTATPTDPIPG